MVSSLKDAVALFNAQVWAQLDKLLEEEVPPSTVAQAVMR